MEAYFRVNPDDLTSDVEPIPQYWTPWTFYDGSREKITRPTWHQQFLPDDTNYISCINYPDGSAEDVKGLDLDEIFTKMKDYENIQLQSKRTKSTYGSKGNDIEALPRAVF